MKLRYRIEERGWFVPQYQISDKEEWKDIKVKNLGQSSSHLYNIAYDLGIPRGFSGNIFHFTGKPKEEMALLFDNELKVCAFLGAFKMAYSNRTKEVNL